MVKLITLLRYHHLLVKRYVMNLHSPKKQQGLIDYQNVLISIPGEKEVKKFKEETGVAFAEPGFFDILDFPLIQGDKNPGVKKIQIQRSLQRKLQKNISALLKQPVKPSGLKTR